MACSAVYFLRILNWIESSLWTIRCLRPTFAVIGDFQMQWSDGQKLGNLQLSAIWDVSNWCAFFCSYGRIESMPTVYICVFCSRLVSWLHVPPPPSTLPAFSQDFSLHSSDIATLLGIVLPSSSLPRWQGLVTLHALSPGLHCLSGLFLSVLSWTGNFEQV